ncbi:uncharacterized protein KY384_007320 [Bacidia gigantensis]|uniref:uncharacterized protein n=1 Tax=Bacidia gigantensis TaxID=2732470 RepID=UPI001D05974F|nr:uncharacterized protein KY384_007320 [Bacidia gigantensis]KAG8528402.1 hypothetical protein KY384_007320 [Bacidia gigantensis]
MKFTAIILAITALVTIGMCNPDDPNDMTSAEMWAEIEGGGQAASDSGIVDEAAIIYNHQPHSRKQTGLRDPQYRPANSRGLRP